MTLHEQILEARKRLIQTTDPQERTKEAQTLRRLVESALQKRKIPF